MPFYNTQNAAVFPNKPRRPQVARTKRHEYLYMTRKELIALCDDRKIKSLKGTPVGRNQQKAYYINLLVQWDKFNITEDAD